MEILGFKKTAALILIAFIIAFIIGFAVGVNLVINKVVDIASRFVEIDKNLVYLAITQYKNNIGNCYPPKLTYANFSFNAGY